MLLCSENKIYSILVLIFAALAAIRGLLKWMNEPSSDGYDLVPSNTWQNPTFPTAQVF